MQCDGEGNCGAKAIVNQEACDVGYRCSSGSCINTGYCGYSAYNRCTNDRYAVRDAYRCAADATCTYDVGDDTTDCGATSQTCDNICRVKNTYTCSGGTCGTYTSYTNCASNQYCSSGSCTTGACASDSCGVNTLSVNYGCSSGNCVAGATYTCSSSSHTNCQSVSCGGSTRYCTYDGSSWAWRTTKPSESYSAGNCNDGIDNDCDGKTDTDPECCTPDGSSCSTDSDCCSGKCDDDTGKCFSCSSCSGYSRCSNQETNECDSKCGASSACDDIAVDTCPSQGYICADCIYTDRDNAQAYCEDGTGCTAYTWVSAFTSNKCCGDDGATDDNSAESGGTCYYCKDGVYGSASCSQGSSSCSDDGYLVGTTCYYDEACTSGGYVAPRTCSVADVCGTTTLTTGKTCSASGCTTGTTHTCSSSSHTNGESQTCGGTTYHCTYENSTWAWRTSTPPETCNDGVDNDLDGKTDCDDTDCELDPTCCRTEGGTCVNDSYCCENYYCDTNDNGTCFACTLCSGVNKCSNYETNECESQCGASVECDDKQVDSAWNDNTTCYTCKDCTYGNDTDVGDGLCDCSSGTCGQGYCFNETSKACYYKPGGGSLKCDENGWDNYDSPPGINEYDDQAVYCPDFCINDSDGGTCTQTTHNPAQNETCYWNSNCSTDGCSLTSSGTLREDYCDICNSTGNYSTVEFCPSPGGVYGSVDGAPAGGNGSDYCFSGTQSCSGTNCTLTKQTLVDYANSTDNPCTEPGNWTYNETSGKYTCNVENNYYDAACSASGWSIVSYRENTAPTVISIEINPSLPTRTDTLICSFTAKDAESVNLTAHVSWYKEGALQSSLNETVACMNGTRGSASISHTTANIVGGETWTCSVVVSDDMGKTSSAANASKYVLKDIAVLYRDGTYDDWYWSDLFDGDWWDGLVSNGEKMCKAGGMWQMMDNCYFYGGCGGIPERRYLYYFSIPVNPNKMLDRMKLTPPDDGTNYQITAVTAEKEPGTSP